MHIVSDILDTLFAAIKIPHSGHYLRIFRDNVDGAELQDDCNSLTSYIGLPRWEMITGIQAILAAFHNRSRTIVMHHRQLLI